MNVVVDWLIPNKVLLACNSGKINIEDVQASSTLAEAFLNDATHPIIFIVDESRMEGFPADPRAIVSSAKWMKHSNLGWLVAFGNDNRFIGMITHIGTQLANIRFRRESTWQDTLNFLHHIADDLPADDQITARYQEIVRVTENS